MAVKIYFYVICIVIGVIVNNHCSDLPAIMLITDIIICGILLL